MRVTYKAQSLYVFLENIDRQQTLRLQVWTDRQKDLEEKHQEYLQNMATMFPKVGLLPCPLSSEGEQRGGPAGESLRAGV